MFRHVHCLNDAVLISFHYRPRNLLVNADCRLKIADFGLARMYSESNNGKIAPMTDYVTTRWYRAPEILVGWPVYSSAVDMWAVGCIIAELIKRNPLFPGVDTSKQIDIIINMLGKPDKAFIKRSKKVQYRCKRLAFLQSIGTVHAWLCNIMLQKNVRKKCSA